MKLSQIKTILATDEAVDFQPKNREMVPEPFHLSEIGIITNNYIDCGGNVTHKQLGNFQFGM